MPMQTITTAEDLQPLSSHPALLVLWGGAHCGVCQAIRPRLEALMAEHFAAAALAYVDCADAPALCAQEGVFSLPVLRFYVHGQLALSTRAALACSRCWPMWSACWRWRRIRVPCLSG